jgi:hypothetical protein
MQLDAGQFRTVEPVRGAEQRSSRYISELYNIALVFAGLGETERSLEWLQQAFEERDVHMPFLLDHKWNGIRSNAPVPETPVARGFRQLIAGPI